MPMIRMAPKKFVIVVAMELMERAPPAPNSQPTAVTTTTPQQRGRPKPPEHKRAQAATPADEDVDMLPPPPSGQTSQRVGIGKALFPPDQLSQTQALKSRSVERGPGGSLIFYLDSCVFVDTVI